MENQTRWRINFYSAYLDDCDLLKCCDIIWLNHSEKDATLAMRETEVLKVEYVKSYKTDNY